MTHVLGARAHAAVRLWSPWKVSVRPALVALETGTPPRCRPSPLGSNSSSSSDQPHLTHHQCSAHGGGVGDTSLHTGVGGGSHHCTQGWGGGHVTAHRGGMGARHCTQGWGGHVTAHGGRVGARHCTRGWGGGHVTAQGDGGRAIVVCSVNLRLSRVGVSGWWPAEGGIPYQTQFCCMRF